MQWILQNFEDSDKVAQSLANLGIPYSCHTLIPFTNLLSPPAEIIDQNSVILFGSYAFRRVMTNQSLWPGIFEVGPFISEVVWHPFLLNAPASAILGEVREIPSLLVDCPRGQFFFRPVMDSKEEPGVVLTKDEIVTRCKAVVATPTKKRILGTLRPDTRMMLTEPVMISQEWRVWIVKDVPVAWSLYKVDGRLCVRREISDEALKFTARMARLNVGYSPAYVMDVCQTSDGMRIIETNCLNAAGFYAADLSNLILALEGMDAEVFRSGEADGPYAGSRSPLS